MLRTVGARLASALTGSGSGIHPPRRRNTTGSSVDDAQPPASISRPPVVVAEVQVDLLFVTRPFGRETAAQSLELRLAGQHPMASVSAWASRRPALGIVVALRQPALEPLDASGPGPTVPANRDRRVGLAGRRGTVRQPRGRPRRGRRARPAQPRFEDRLDRDDVLDLCSSAPRNWRSRSHCAGDRWNRPATACSRAAASSTWQRRLAAFGVTLVRLDLRQDASRHTEALSAITTHLRLGNYAEWTEEARERFLLQELQSRRPLVPPDLEATPEVREVFETFRVAALLPQESVGAYVISMTIAMLNGRMSKDPKWLTAIAGLSESDAKRLSANAQKILRSEMLIFLRWAITLVKFERELYRDPGQNLNRLWWELVERYQMVTPPPNRDLPDWASKNHLATSPVYYQNYVLGELMASQLISFIHKDVVKSDEFVGYPAVGTYLVDAVFKPGSRYVWSEMLRRGTAEDLNPDYFVRQFV